VGSFSWRFARPISVCQLNPRSSTPLRKPPTGLRLVRYGNVLATARQIGKDGAEADGNGVHAGKFPKIAAFSVNSGVFTVKRHTGVLVLRRSKSGADPDASCAKPDDCLAATRISSPIARE